MSALTSLLVRDELVSVEDIEQALQRQVLEGGEVDTALLELDAIPENTLSAYRACTFRLPAASRAELMSVSAEALAAVAVEIAEQFRVVPLSIREGVLTLAIATPLPRPLAQTLANRIGLAIRFCIAAEVRVEAALTVHYGIRIPGRMRLLAEQLEKRDAGQLPEVLPLNAEETAQLEAELFQALSDDQPAPQLREPEPPVKPFPHVQTKTHRVPAAAHPAAPARHSPPPPAAEESDSGVVRVSKHMPVGAAGGPVMPSERPAAPQPAPKAPAAAPARTSGPHRPAPFHRLRGPLVPERAHQLLEEARNRDEITEVLFSFGRQYFDATALFSMRDDRVVGLQAHGLPGVGDIHAVSIPFERGGALERLRTSAMLGVLDLSKRPADRRFASTLGRMDAQPSTLIPIMVRHRPVLALYGDRDGESFHMDELADVIELLPAVGRAYERVIRAQKVLAAAPRGALAGGKAAPRAQSPAPPPQPAQPQPSPALEHRSGSPPDNGAQRSRPRRTLRSISDALEETASSSDPEPDPGQTSRMG